MKWKASVNAAQYKDRVCLEECACVDAYDTNGNALHAKLNNIYEFI